MNAAEIGWSQYFSSCLDVLVSFRPPYTSSVCSVDARMMNEVREPTRAATAVRHLSLCSCLCGSSSVATGSSPCGTPGATFQQTVIQFWSTSHSSHCWWYMGLLFCSVAASSAVCSAVLFLLLVELLPRNCGLNGWKQHLHNKINLLRY